MIVLFQGRKGSGKTLSMTFWGLVYKKAGWKLMSNYALKGIERFDKDFLYKLNTDSSIKNIVLLVDELPLYFDARLWKGKKAIGFSQFIQQIRKRNIIILGTAQFIGLVELRIRQNSDVLVKCKFDKKQQKCVNTIYDITSLEDSKTPNYFKLKFNAPFIYPYYDTKEIL